MREVILFLVACCVLQSHPLQLSNVLSQNVHVDSCTSSVGCSLRQNGLRFLVFGDWGGQTDAPYVTALQLKVAKQLAEVCKRNRIDFVLGVGDNFYSRGVENLDSRRFKATFEEVYVEPSLMLPWYISAGNHDHYGNITAQLLYSKLSRRWHFPSPNYGILYKLSSNLVVEIVVIDSVELCGMQKDSSLAPFQHILLDADRELRWKWLADRLSHSKAHYLFVTGHYPVWSIGSHGPTACLVHRLEPLLRRYAVNAYFSGHDHNLQHLRTAGANATIDYVVSGTGGMTDPLANHMQAVPAGSSLFFWPPKDVKEERKGGFVQIAVDEHNGTATFFDAALNVVYRFNFEPR